MNIIQKIVNKLTKGKWVLLPTTPTKELLTSMAIRYDHSFGFDLADDKIYQMRVEQPIMAGQYLTVREKEVVLKSMNQLHEEVVGKGFYKL